MLHTGKRSIQNVESRHGYFELAAAQQLSWYVLLSPGVSHVPQACTDLYQVLCQIMCSIVSFQVSYVYRVPRTVMVHHTMCYPHATRGCRRSIRMQASTLFTFTQDEAHEPRARSKGINIDNREENQEKGEGSSETRRKREEVSPASSRKRRCSCGSFERAERCRCVCVCVLHIHDVVFFLPVVSVLILGPKVERYKLCGHKTTKQSRGILHYNAIKGVDNNTMACHPTGCRRVERTV